MMKIVKEKLVGQRGWEQLLGKEVVLAISVSQVFKVVPQISQET